MKSNDWRHKNVARYTPGNTKILYFFNCLLDGMHTKRILICDFSRGVLNTHSEATNKDSFILRGLCFGCGRKKWNLLLKNLEIRKRLTLAAEVKSEFMFKYLGIRQKVAVLRKI